VGPNIRLKLPAGLPARAVNIPRAQQTCYGCRINVSTRDCRSVSAAAGAIDNSDGRFRVTDSTASRD